MNYQQHSRPEPRFKPVSSYAAFLSSEWYSLIKFENYIIFLMSWNEIVLAVYIGRLLLFTGIIISSSVRVITEQV